MGSFRAGEEQTHLGFKENQSLRGREYTLGQERAWGPRDSGGIDHQEGESSLDGRRAVEEVGGRGLWGEEEEKRREDLRKVWTGNNARLLFIWLMLWIICVNFPSPCTYE